MLPFYLSEHAIRRVDELISDVKISYLREFPWEEFFYAMCAPHMRAYDSLPLFMKEVSTTNRPEVHFRIDDKTPAIPVLHHDRRDLPAAVRQLPLGYGALQLRAEDIPASHRLAFVQLVISLDKAESKGEHLANVVRTIAGITNTPAQACAVWSPFRALLPKASSRYSNTVSTVSEKGRPRLVMRSSVSDPDKALATTILAEFDFISSMLTKK